MYCIFIPLLRLRRWRLQMSERAHIHLYDVHTQLCRWKPHTHTHVRSIHRCNSNICICTFLFRCTMYHIQNQENASTLLHFHSIQFECIELAINSLCMTLHYTHIYRQQTVDLDSGRHGCKCWRLVNVLWISISSFIESCTINFSVYFKIFRM